MKEPEEIKNLSSSLYSVQKLIEQFDGKGIFIGGLAVAVFGEPRFTADTDAMFLLSNEDLPEFVSSAEKLGLIRRIPDVIKFAEKSRVILLRHESSGIDVDILMGMLPFEVEAIERSQEVQLGSHELRLPTPEDLIIFKAVAGRPKDKSDIESIIQIQDNLDRERIKFWTTQFAEFLENPEIWTHIEALLA